MEPLPPPPPPRGLSKFKSVNLRYPVHVALKDLTFRTHLVMNAIGLHRHISMPAMIEILMAHADAVPISEELLRTHKFVVGDPGRPRKRKLEYWEYPGDGVKNPPVSEDQPSDNESEEETSPNPNPFGGDYGIEPGGPGPDDSRR